MITSKSLPWPMSKTHTIKSANRNCELIFCNGAKRGKRHAGEWRASQNISFGFTSDWREKCIVLSTNMAALSHGCKPRTSTFYLHLNDYVTIGLLTK